MDWWETYVSTSRIASSWTKIVEFAKDAMMDSIILGTTLQINLAATVKDTG